MNWNLLVKSKRLLKIIRKYCYITWGMASRNASFIFSWSNRIPATVDNWQKVKQSWCFFMNMTRQFYFFFVTCVCLSVYPSVCQTDGLSIHPSGCPFVCLSVCLFVCLSVCLSFCPSFCPSVCLLVGLCVCPSVCLPVSQPVCLTVYFLCVSIYLFGCLNRL